MEEEERKILMNRFITKQEFLTMLETIDFTHIKMCEIELIHGFRLVIDDDNTQNIIPLTTDFRLNY